MRALTVRPGTPGSAEIVDVPEPEAAGDVLVETLAVGICGTDLEIVHAGYGEAPAGEDRLVIGHESLGRVLEAPPDSALRPDDLVVGIVRCPDPVPCSSCAAGEWDMCRNGLYTEHGIKGLHGFAAERFSIDARFAVPVPAALGDLGILVEPASVLAKAWEHIEHIGKRAHWEPRTVVVTGAGPIGLLAALLAVQRGLDVHVLDIVESGPKPDLVAALGGTYHTRPINEVGLEPDIIIECSGVPGVMVDVLTATGRSGITCFVAAAAEGQRLRFDAAALTQELVLENDTVFGTVNANRRHYEQGLQALRDADPDWLRGLITRRVPFDRFTEALERRSDDVKVVLDIAEQS